MKKRYLLFSSCLVLALSSCLKTNNSSYDPVDSSDDDMASVDYIEDSNFEDWDDATHSKNVDPNFDVVFAQDVVQRIDLTITDESWSSMWSDLAANILSGSTMTDDYTPIFVPCTFTYNDTDWYQVGVRYKGNSSLAGAYSSGNQKLSMKLDFDEFEDDYPDLKNQRFYGFKQLNLANNYNDKSFMRDKMASDLFMEFGMVAAHTAYYELYINGAFFGLYTMIEEVDDTVIEDQYGDDSGNLYKPEDDAASFASGTYNTEEFYIKDGDELYEDVLELYTVLNSSVRISDPATWRENLEAVFNVDTFMKWVSVTLSIQNWDTYGNIAHNYYLYNNPADNLLTWIPWDHNEAFQSATGNYRCFEPDELSQNKYTGSSWPLLYYLSQQDEYMEILDQYLQEFIDNHFYESNMSAKYETYYNLIKSYVYSETSGRTFLNSYSDFDTAVSTLKTHASTRHSAIESYLE
ncbi:MAG: CotH kinase family protein [Rikenellaceae bacterium]